MLEKNNYLLLKVLILMVLGLTQTLMAAGDPVATLKNVAITQANDNVIPIAIMWIIGFAAIFTFALKSPYPLFLGVIAILFMTVGPDVAPSFASYDFTATTTTP